MTLTQHIDYVTTYFPHKVPTLVRGVPNYANIKRVKTELRANASSVDSELGGGDHGYLGLVLSNVEYLAVPGVNGNMFQPPAYPRAFVISPTASAVEALQRREAHNEQIRLYRECQNVEKAIMKHLQNSFQSQYLEAFVDEDTALLSSDVPTILAHLFSRYGQVTGDEVRTYQTEVLSTSFTPADPLVTIWNPIQKLKKLASQANIPYSEAQLIEFGLQLIRSTHDFEIATREWNAKPDLQKTWDNLKLHFSQAQEELKRIRGPTMVQAGFHQINHIASEMKEEFLQTRMELANMTAMMRQSEEEEQETQQMETAPVSESVNLSAENNYQMEMLKLLRSMQNEINTLKQGNNGNSTKTTSNRNKGKKQKTPDNPSFTRRVTTSYCWTHGGCAHDSASCTARAQGHKDNATFDDKKGGSKAFCE